MSDSEFGELRDIRGGTGLSGIGAGTQKQLSHAGGGCAHRGNYSYAGPPPPLAGQTGRHI